MTQQEEQFEKLMKDLGIKYTTKYNNRLDYYLPAYDLIVELKTYECNRLLSQLKSVSGQNVMVLVGPNAITAFGYMLKNLQLGIHETI